MSNPMWSLINPTSGKKKKIKFTALQSTGFINLDYLHEEMMESLDSGQFFAAITTANTLVELAVRYYLIFATTLTRQATFEVAVKRYNLRTIDKCFDNLAEHGVRRPTVVNLHHFHRSLTDYFVRGSIAHDQTVTKQGAHYRDPDEIDYNGLVHYGFVAPLALLQHTEAMGLFATSFATKLLARDIPFHHMLAASEVPDFKIHDTVYFTKSDKPAVQGQERKIYVSEAAFLAFEQLRKNLNNGSE